MRKAKEVQVQVQSSGTVRVGHDVIEFTSADNHSAAFANKVRGFFLILLGADGNSEF